MAKQTNIKGKINRSGDDTKLTRRQGEYKKAASKKKKNIDKKSNDDWIASLAKDTLAKDNAASNNGNNIPSKEDRKRKREAKKNRRMEQKELQQQQREQQQQQPNLKKTARTTQATTTTRTRTPTGKSKSSSSVLLELSKNRLQNLSQNLQNVYKDIVHNEKKEEHDKSSSSTSDDKKIRRTPYYLPGDVNANAIRNSVSTAKMRKRKLNEDTIQPRSCDYSGIGMARNSMLIEFVDPSYYPKLEEEFHEHIPGFFGKQRTKAMKKQTDGNMLWRRMANSKQGMSKKLKGMSPDERVESMIDSGLM
ncbi:hypothetical protein FRACYDRAFT_240059 [Fragilariopsis cylindrus CCMP1102]|uniref:Uncharacterized protein n=1 Tax=Fragilariopsis cylindrus CCMP1102 TaxID=635003 RepID=A0A1E7FC41_9STRA|nr:hypothetical protein FRACYDRAFT_240059 [Fragilariopsis cylindrus CCMP1102]|eukprot:OEU15373.1 hypothetical protein FRACYDRAFT_240059 [Fragilariopsis cylindrus CCMP1102]